MGVVTIMLTATPAFSQAGFFTREEVVVELAGPAYDLQPFISVDGAELWFGGFGRDSDSLRREIYVSQVAGDGTVSQPRRVEAASSPARDNSPSLSADGTELYFLSDRRGSNDLFILRREPTEDGSGWMPWGAAEPLDDLNDPVFDDGGPCISSDGLELFFHSNREGNPDLWVARRERTGNPETGERVPFGAPEPVAGVINTLGDESNPSISSDGLIIFWSDNANGGLFLANRASTDSGTPFANPRLVPRDLSGSDFHPGISADWPAPDSQIYFARCGLGGNVCDIFRATWVPDCNENHVDDREELLGDECSPGPDGIGPFIRGDSNVDSLVNISDPVHTLNGLFAGGSPSGCAAAADANGDGAVNIADPVYLLNHLFAGGPAPVEPFPACGVSDLPSDKELRCETPPASCQ